MNPATSGRSLRPRPAAGLSLVPAPVRPHSPLALWHLLSLDAPTVAALWTWFVAHSCGLSLPWTSTAAMFLAVWMIYAADRLLDARLLDARLLDARLLDARLLDARLLSSTPQATSLEERHRFHHRHRRPFLTVIACASVLLASLLHRLHPAALHLYALLATILFAYFLLIHIDSPAAAQRLPKELAVGLVFPAAIFIPTVARLPALRLTLAPDALLFAAVCTLNCLYLYAWEHPGERPQAHWTTRFATNHLTALTTLTTALAAILLALQRHHPVSRLWLLPASCGLAAAILLVLDTHRRRLSPIHLRAAADLALLTPLLALALAAFAP